MVGAVGPGFFHGHQTNCLNLPNLPVTSGRVELQWSFTGILFGSIVATSHDPTPQGKI